MMTRKLFVKSCFVFIFSANADLIIYIKNYKFSNTVFLKMHPEQKVITAHYTKRG